MPDRWHHNFNPVSERDPFCAWNMAHPEGKEIQDRVFESGNDHLFSYMYRIICIELVTWYCATALTSVILRWMLCSGKAVMNDSNGHVGYKMNHNAKAVETTAKRLDKSKFLLYSIKQ